MRQLWQVPTFVAGLLAVLSLLVTFPFSQDGGARHSTHALATVRQLLDEPHVSIERLRALTEEVLSRSEGMPQRAGEAHFLLGSAYLRVAEELPAGQRAEAQRQARAHLEQAATLGVPDADQGRLMYRLGKACYATGADPRRVLELLLPSVEPAADNRADGYAMLTQAYLRLRDWNAALKANEKQLAQPTIQDADAVQARLLRGEILFQLGRTEEAHKVLARIGSGAPRDILFQVRSLRAWNYQGAGVWSKAAGLWQDILKDRSERFPQRGQVLSNLGLCNQQLGRSAEAADNWAEAMRHGGDEGQAAGLRLAELRVRTPEGRARALELYERALQNVTRPADYRNAVLSLAEAQRLVEAGCQVYREAHAYEQAQQLARLLSKLASPRTAQALVGQITEDWARAQREALGQPSGSAADTQEPAEVCLHFREAGAAYVATAEAWAGQPEQAAWWQRAADCYLDGQSFTEAVTILDRLIGLKPPPERLGQAWYKLGEAHRALHDDRRAGIAYQQCIAHDGPFAYHARYRLAMLAMAHGDIDEAEHELQRIVDLTAPLADHEVHEQALFELANFLFHRGQFSQAEGRLVSALQHYRTNPRALLARYQLGECFRQEALREQLNLDEPTLPAAGQAHPRARYQAWLKRALDEYDQVIATLKGRQAAKPLDESEAILLRQTLFAAAECHAHLENFLEACELYQSLLAASPPPAERLHALRELFLCYGAAGNREKASEVLADLKKEVETVLDSDDQTAFSGPPGTWPRQKWKQWLNATRVRDP